MASCYLGLHREIEEKGMSNVESGNAAQAAEKEQARVIEKAIEVCQKALTFFSTQSGQGDAGYGGAAASSNRSPPARDIGGYSRAKPHFRLGKALLIYGDYDRAGEHLTEACRLEPNDKAIRAELEEVKVR